MPHLLDSMTTPHSRDFDDNADDGTRKSDSGNQQPKARFSRRRTHNEQLVVACCGVITARGTMYGAEAISGVKVSSQLNFCAFESFIGILFRTS